jgi:drug/metabolite transporter (DMT)-like permease
MTLRAPGRSAAINRANLKGIGWMVVTGIFFVGVTGIVRHLGSDMNPMQAAFIRYVIGLVLLSPVIFRLGILRMASARVGLHALRGVVHGVAVMAWFYAMTRIPIAEVTALGFTGPIFTTMLVGFGGALVILRPGIEIIDPGAIAMVAAAPLFAGSFLLAKKLTERDSNTVIVAYMAIFVTLALLPPALMVWRTPTWEELGWLLATAVLATLGHLTLTQAFRSAEIMVVQPAHFLQLVWATLLGFYAFDESPDAFTWLGGFIIVASATYIAHRETVTKGHVEPKFEQP